MIKLTVAIVLVGLVLTEASQDVVMQISKTFAKPMELCRKEMDLPESVTKDFMNFWKDDYQLTDRHTGCALMCLSSKLELLDPEYNLHHGAALEFAKKHGADDALAKKLVEMIHECARIFPVTSDPCDRTFQIAKCFKVEIHKLDWAPDMELIVGEILAAA